LPDAEPLIANYRRRSMGRFWRWSLLGGLLVSCLVYGYYFAVLAPTIVLPFTVPAVLLGALLIWALPAGDYAPTKTLGGLYWAFFAALVLWPDYLAIALPGLPWLTLLRLTGGPLAAVLLICISVSAPFRKEMMTCLNDAPFIWKSVLVYVAIVIVTLPFSGDIFWTLNKFVVFLINQIAIFFVSCFVFTRVKRVEVWAYAFLGMCIILCGIGLWENRIGMVPWAGHIPSFLKIEDPSVTRILAGGARAATGIHRVQAVATTSLGLAEVLGLCAPFALHLALGRYPLVPRLIALLCLPLFIEMIILTDARLGMVACLVSGSLYLLLRAVVRWRESHRSIFGPAIVLTYPAIFCALVASTFLIGRLRARVWGDGSQAASTNARKTQWAMGVPKIVSHPWGHGYGTAGKVLGWTNQGGHGSIDSYWLNLLLDTGLLGFVAYLAIFLGSAWVGARAVITTPGSRENRLIMPIAVSCVAFVIVKGVLSQDANHPLMFMMLGALVALIHKSKEADRSGATQVA
jgi:hypothetical protein